MTLNKSEFTILALGKTCHLFFSGGLSYYSQFDEATNISLVAALLNYSVGI